MAWLIPSIIATATGTSILAFCYYYLFLQDQKYYLKIWSISWAVYFIRYAFMLAFLFWVQNPLFLIANQVSSLISGFLLLYGSYLFLEKKLPRFFVYFSVIDAGWIFFSILSKLSFLVISLPTFGFLAIIYVWTGYIFLKHYKYEQKEAQIVGWAFIFWGIHKADYPFLRPVVWFAPWGYLIGAVIEFITALGLILVYFKKTKNALIDKQKQLMDAQKIAKIGDWSWQLSDNQLIWSDETYRIFGQSPSQFNVTVESFEKCIHPDDYDTFISERNAALRENRKVEIEHRILLPDKSVRWVNEISSVEKDENGNITKIKGTVQDINDRKKFEEALQESEENYRMLSEEAPMGILTCDSEGQIEYLNEHMLEILGSPGKEQTKAINLLRFPALQESGFSSFLQKCMETGESSKTELKYASKWGRAFWAIAHIAPLKKDGAVKGALVIATDITDRKAMEQALRESEIKYRNLFENANDGIFVAQDGMVKFMNPSVERITGYSSYEIVEMPFADLIHSEDRKMVFERHMKRLQGKELPSTYIFRVLNKEGRIVWVQLNTVVIHWDGQPATLNFIRDITQEKQLENQLKQSQKMEAVGTLAGGIAHDFNNILSIILGNTELAMLDVPERSPAQDNLKEVREATLRARELVKQILLFARQKEHSLSNIRLEPIAKESLKMLRASIPTTVEINENIQEGLPPVLADPSQIQQIIMNLCTNAGQVMEAEGGALTFTMDIAEFKAPLNTIVEELPPGRYVRMEVRDTGPGIPPENLERIFDPFFTTKGVGEGTGLGLAVVQGIVQDRKGGIIVESEEGRGSAFSIYLPASEGESLALKAEQQTELPRGTERVLFVDDELMIMKLGKHMLERQGYDVEIRGSGTDALQCFRENPNHFDLVVTDMSMPGMRGDRLAEEILAIRPDIPVILSTGYSRQISKEKAQEMGIRAFVMKPLTQYELTNTVRRVLDERDRK